MDVASHINYWHHWPSLKVSALTWALFFLASRSNGSSAFLFKSGAPLEEAPSFPSFAAPVALFVVVDVAAVAAGA